MVSKCELKIEIRDLEVLPTRIENSMIRWNTKVSGYKANESDFCYTDLTVNTYDGYLILEGKIRSKTDLTIWLTQA